MPVLPSRYFAPRYWASRYFGTRAPDTRAVIIQIADAVAAALENASLSQSFTVTRSYVPVKDIKDMGVLTLEVVPAGIANVRSLARGILHQYDYLIAVGIRKKTEPLPAGFDPLVFFTQEVGDLFRGKPLVGYETAFCLEHQNNPAFSADHADEKRIYFSVFVLTFRVLR